jgi:hypothetical protein
MAYRFEPDTFAQASAYAIAEKEKKGERLFPSPMESGIPQASQDPRRKAGDVRDAMIAAIDRTRFGNVASDPSFKKEFQNFGELIQNGPFGYEMANDPSTKKDGGSAT